MLFRSCLWLGLGLSLGLVLVLGLARATARARVRVRVRVMVNARARVRLRVNVRARCSFYFSEDFLSSLFLEAGFNTVDISVYSRQIENRSRNITMDRCVLISYLSFYISL